MESPLLHRYRRDRRKLLNFMVSSGLIDLRYSKVSWFQGASPFLYTCVSDFVAALKLHRNIDQSMVKDKDLPISIHSKLDTVYGDGKYVVREALKFLDSPNSPLKTLALAGRNTFKLSQTLKWASTSHPAVPFIVADTSDPSSLRRMASQAKLVLDCVGPFRLYGEPVVATCVEMGCDYLDISDNLLINGRITVVLGDYWNVGGG
ncbi:hypothetical protein L2E82_16420 [Cichorium intybus]|uniref:Uncharacterized protein n=1 Tax=Cichorium intybus TaxID=13427 RepID=A0ACB9F5J0_CICIN|nr:hypothetical protein L2E82_16420 [Cichorium intybus]